jgi:hypothetical protein
MEAHRINVSCYNCGSLWSIKYHWFVIVIILGIFENCAVWYKTIYVLKKLPADECIFEEKNTNFNRRVTALIEVFLYV